MQNWKSTRESNLLSGKENMMLSLSLALPLRNLRPFGGRGKKEGAKAAAGGEDAGASVRTA